MLDAKAFLKNVSARRQDVQETEEKPPRANGARPKASQNKQDTLPHAPEAEKAILAILLQHPETIAKASRASTSWQFFLPTHREIFQTLVDVNDSGGRVGLIELTQILGDRGRLANIGGPSFLTELQTAVAVPESLDWFISVVREKACLREVISTGSKMIRAAHGLTDTTELPGMIDDFSRMVERIKQDAGGHNGSELFTIPDLMSFDSSHDPDCLIGNRYIVKGGSALWAGGSGYGKSSLILQLAVYWACGVPCFGLRPLRPLRSVIIQAENNEGDMAEQLQGVFSGISKLGDLDIEKCREQIEQNLIIRRTLKTGLHFLGLLDELCEMDKPDLVWPDPLFAFAGCDLMNQKETTRFLRDGLFPIADRRNVALNVVHHVGKPVRGDSKERSQMADIDYQYLGFGSSEIQNSFRAVNTLTPVGKSGVYKLTLSKRGERAGATDAEGKWTRNLFITHSKEGICWMQTDEPEKPSNAGKLKYTEDHILDEMSIATGVTVVALQTRLKDNCGMSSATFYRLWDGLKKAKKVKPDGDGGWLKQPKISLAN